MSAILAALVFASVPPPTSGLTPSHLVEPGVATPLAAARAIDPIDRASFQDAMRKLWEDHVTWTRLYLVSAIAGLSDVDPTAQRLLRNQADIGAAIKPFYGDAAGDRLTALLRSHILIAADLVTAAKAGNSTGMQTASARWDANAVEIADFLSAANPAHWPQETMRAEMRHHLALTLREAQARLKSDWAGDIAAYDEVHTHILGLADVLATGIIKQFPKQFSR